MLAISDSMKEAYNQYTTQRKSYIQVGENSFFVQNLDVVADCYEDGNVIGNAIAKIVKFDIETDNIKSLDEFELFDGIWTGNQYEYVSLGTFKLFNEEGTDDFFSSVTAYDKLVLFNKEYDALQTTYPTTLYGLLQNICAQAGVELENISIPNGEHQIEENLFVENETLKTILNGICQINGCIGIISRDKLKLLLRGTETINLSKHQLSSPEYKRTTWKINQVVLGMTDVEGEYVLRQDDNDVDKNGVHKLVINDNPFVYTQELREQYIDNLFNQVNGFGYTAFSAKWEGLPFVELGDLANVGGKESIVLRYNLKSPKGLESTLEAPSIIDSVVEYVDNSNSTVNKQKRTEYFVDKSKQQIQSLVIQTEQLTDVVNENSDNIAEIGSKYTQSLEQFEFNIADLTETINSNNENLQNEIDNINNGLSEGVETLKNSLVTININGIKVATSLSKISTIMTNDTFAIQDNTGTYLAYFGYDEEAGRSKAEMDNLTINNYFTAGYHRQEKFEIDGEKRTGWFYVGGSI